MPENWPWIRKRSRGELTRAAIEAYQLDKLNETLALCRARSPFYRQKLAGLPVKLTSLADLQALPFTTGG
jgi:phenylacetate-CoA ligase